MLSKRQQAKIRRQNEAALARDEDVDWTPQLERDQDNRWNDEAPKPMIWKPPPIETKAPVLTFYNLSKELVLENDMSNYGLGSMLLQDGIGKSMAYTSHSLSCAERHYAQIEKEMLSQLLGLDTCHYVETCGVCDIQFAVIGNNGDTCATLAQGGVRPVLVGRHVVCATYSLQSMVTKKTTFPPPGGGGVDLFSWAGKD
ncbi:hypothetical protein LSAT2_020545 [Lamellibrachia satsuma]|nr:hypothetical protein LSAT2_020545 [Lamellibrachia satsuma]